MLFELKTFYSDREIIFTGKYSKCLRNNNVKYTIRTPEDKARNVFEFFIFFDR